MQQWIKEVARGKKRARDLSYEEALEAARMIVEGKANENLKLADQTALIKQVLLGRGKETEAGQFAHTLVTYNTGLRYYLLNHTPTIKEGIALAEGQLIEQKGWRHLNKWKEMSNETHTTHRTRQQRQRGNCPV
jgi:anthranilate phosphoribosyltransferase